MRTRSLLRQYIIWTMLLVIVPCLVIMAIYSIVQVQMAKEENQNLIRQRVESQKRLIDHWMYERAITVKELSALESVRNLEVASMERIFAGKQQYDKNFDSLSYIDKDGLFKMSTLNGGIHYPSTVGKPYYEAALAGKDYISDVVVGRNSGQPIINFSSPVYDNNGDFQGLILGSVRTTSLVSLFHENWMGDTGQIRLINQDGFFLAEPRNPNGLKALGLLQDTAVLKVKVSEELLSQIQRGSSGTIVWNDLLGKRVWGYYIKVPERGWTLIGKIDAAEVMAPIYKQLTVMSIGVVVLLLLILPLASLLTNQIKRPIEWLVEQSNLVAAENYSQVGQQKCPEKIPAELDALCRTFIQMGRKIDDASRVRNEDAEKITQLYLESTAQAEKFGNLAAMTAGVAHEIAQPLTSIKGIADSALYWHGEGESVLPDDVISDMEVVSQQADRIDKIIRQTRSLAHKHRMDVSRCNLNAIVYDVLSEIQTSTSAKDISLNISLDESLPPVLGNQVGIAEIVTNLTVNAAKALDKTDRLGKAIAVRTIRCGDYAQLEISDNGPGIDEAIREKIFEPFFTTDPTGNGMGLGLSIVKAVVAAHNGHIDVSPNHPQGTVFRVKFPLAEVR